MIYGKNLIFMTLLWLVIAASGYGKIPILQGPTSPTQTQVAVLVKNDEILSFTLRSINTNKIYFPSYVHSYTFKESNSKIIHAIFYDLEAGQSYQFKVQNDRAEVVDTRRLKTWKNKDFVDFSVASCMDDSYHELPKTIWQELASLKPDVLFLIGDNVYADRHNEMPLPNGSNDLDLWQRYVETRNNLSLFYLDELIPIIAVWDDHDYGLNNGDSSYKFKNHSYQTFRAFFPQHPIDGLYELGPGISASLQINGQKFIFLDNRYFRQNKSGTRNGVHFGAIQDAWLLSQLSDDKPTWLISGDQFFGGYHHFESFEGNFFQDFQSFISKLRSAASKVAFISGDRHLFELMEIEPSLLGYKSYEITSSGIHAKVYPSSWEREPNPRQLVGFANINNFALIRSKPLPDWEINVKAFAPGKKLLTEKSLSIGRGN